MAYIGRDPAFAGLVTQVLTPDGSTQAFALNYNIATASSVIVVVGGVVQKPDVGYTVTSSGSEITFSEAPAADLDVFLIYLSRETITIAPGDGTVTADKLASGAVTSAKLDSSLAISGTFTTGSLVATNINVTSNATVTGAYFERANVTASAVDANITLDASSGGFTYFTANATANTTVNLVGVSSLPTNQSATFVLAQTNGSSPKYVSAVQVEGAAANTILWQNGSAPTSGNAANVDVYTFTTVKTAESTYTVFASQAQFG